MSADGALPAEVALADAARACGHAPFARVTFAAPSVPPERLLRAALPGPRVYWAPPGDDAVASIGAAALLPPGSPETLRRDAAALLDGVRELSTESPRARMFAAIPFAPHPDARGLDAGLVVLPRWQCLRTSTRTWLSAIVAREELATASGVWRLAEEQRRIFAALASSEPPSPLPRVLHVDPGHREAWLARAREAVEEIRRGGFEKVVSARSTTLVLDAPPDVVALAQRLADEAGWGARVALQHGGTGFVAAAPERLVRREGLRVRSEALAGTIDAADAAALTSSRKDAAEHGCVVRVIASVLGSVCESLSIPERPSVRALRTVHHLHTPIEGVLRAPVHVLDLVAALHPTPAVGGAPREAAARWLADHDEPRGLYAGPIGWFDADGDGDFWVALRGGDVRGPRVRAWAGAGLVRDSDPASELRETELKQRALLRALGAS